jgi:hypothetical protein
VWADYEQLLRDVFSTFCGPIFENWEEFLTASYASLAVLGIAFRGRRRRQHFWKFAAFFQKNFFSKILKKNIFEKFSELF